MELLQGMVIFIVLGVVLVNFAPAVILDIIWIIRVKNGKSKKFGPLGIISIIVTGFSLLGLPFVLSLLWGLIGFI